LNLPIILSHIGGLLPVDLYANRDEEVLAIWRRGVNRAWKPERSGATVLFVKRLRL
jgi:hypothetical protein